VTVESCGKRLFFSVFKSGVLNFRSFWACHISVYNEITVGDLCPSPSLLN
jgi:hypothetical protein